LCKVKNGNYSQVSWVFGQKLLVGGQTGWFGDVQFIASTSIKQKKEGRWFKHKKKSKCNVSGGVL